MMRMAVRVLSWVPSVVREAFAGARQARVLKSCFAGARDRGSTTFRTYAFWTVAVCPQVAWMLGYFGTRQCEVETEKLLRAGRVAVFAG